MRISEPIKDKEKAKEVLLYILEKLSGKSGVDEETLRGILYFIDFDFYEKHEQQLMGLTYKKHTI